MQPKVTVIVPVYNAEKTIRKCIDSILKQNYSNIELLLINDGSKDNSGYICDEYSHSYNNVKTFHQSNKGVSQARNNGIENSTGEYILFVDSDDFLDLACLKTLLSFPVADLTYMSSNVHFSTGDVTSYHLKDQYLTQRNDIEKEILHLKSNPQGYVYFGYTWNKLFKASIIKEHHIRFINGLNFYEDDAFTLEYLRFVKSLRTISKSLYNYTVNEGGLTMTPNTCKEFEALIDANLKNIQFFDYPELYKYELGRLFSFSLQAIRQAKKQKQQNTYKHLIKRTFQLYTQYIRPNHVPIRNVYKRNNFLFFKLSILLHKR